MRRYNRFTVNILMLLLGTCLLLGCKRRPLEDAGNVAMVPFSIDWSRSGLDVSKMHRATIRVFPHDGSPAYDFRLQEDLTQVEVPLAVGKYSFVIFNETTDTEDWKRLVFTGLDKYDQFAVTAIQDTFKGLYTKADESIVLKTPEAIAAWSLDEFEVTREMIIHIRNRAKSGNTEAEFVTQDQQANLMEKMLGKVTNITPLSVVKTLNILARVENLVSAQRSSGAISGATQGIRFCDRKATAGGATHIFVMNGREYDDPVFPKHGTIRASILVFNVENVENAKYELTIDFLLHNGKLHPSQVFDITKNVTQNLIEININVGFNTGDNPSDHPIVLPEGIDGGDVAVDEWDEVIVPIG